jgi:hypothetical protein
VRHAPPHAPPRHTEPGALDLAAAVAQGALMVAVGAAAGAATRRRGARVVGGAVAALVGGPYAAAVARHAPYERSRRGGVQWLVDSSWSAPNTVAGAVFLAHQRAVGNPELPDRSRGSGSIWLERSAVPGYATTIGIVKAGSSDRVDAHEDVHVLQARLLGPLYLPLVALDYVLATLFPFWLRHRAPPAAPIRSVRDYFHRGVYREVWHERWAYAAAPVRRTSAPRR